jgi:uncharacterized membrane protein
MKQKLSDSDETIIDKPIRVEFIDMPKMYHYTD